MPCIAKRFSNSCATRRCAVANASAFKPGDLIRWFMIFELTSDQDPNYKHIHTLKGIGQLTLGPWTQFTPIFCLPETKPCNHDEASIKAISVRRPSERPAT